MRASLAWNATSATGADAFVKAKLNGVHQLVGVITGDYHRPIKTPIKNLRPARETCEQCHWPQKFVGNIDRTYQSFLTDETNTPFAVRLSLKVGGADPTHGPVGGIHWHMSQDNKIEYIATDERRQVIPWVRVTDPQGVVTEYRTPKFTNDVSRYRNSPDGLHGLPQSPGPSLSVSQRRRELCHEHRQD